MKKRRATVGMPYARPVMSAICSGLSHKSHSPQAGSLVFLDNRLSCVARMASASDVNDIPNKFRYGPVSVAC